VPQDEESVELQELLSSGLPAGELATMILGIEPDHPLFPHLVEVTRLRLGR
jgi:mannitol-1-phosphate 5-dehydrogenase